MKTNVFLKAVVMVAVVMAGVMNFSVRAASPEQFVSNTEMTDGRMTAKTIFRNENGYLTRHLRYTYTYDAENRVTGKEAYRWNSEKEAWMPYFQMNMAYHEREVEVSYARWNPNSHAYDSKMEKAVYPLYSDSAVQMLAHAR